jgi:predicted DNA-binding transcriptional regulator AlpA
MSEEISPEEDRTLRTPEAAAILGRPVSTLRYWRHVGKGPRSFTMGGWIVVYRESDVRAWLAEQYENTVTTPEDKPGW